ncbi:hypothetical protein ACP4OV_011235 [Aristida adscensionis]
MPPNGPLHPLPYPPPRWMGDGDDWYGWGEGSRVDEAPEDGRDGEQNTVDQAHNDAALENEDLSGAAKDFAASDGAGAGPVQNLKQDEAQK